MKIKYKTLNMSWVFLRLVQGSSGCKTTHSNSPVSYSARHQRPARERHKIRIASRENVDNQTPRNTNFTH